MKTLINSTLERASGNATVGLCYIEVRQFCLLRFLEENLSILGSKES